MQPLVIDDKPLWENSAPLWCEASKAEKYINDAFQAVNYTLLEHHAFGTVIENLGPEISRLVITKQPKYLPGSSGSFDLLNEMGHFPDDMEASWQAATWHGLKRAEALGVSWRADWDHG